MCRPSVKDAYTYLIVHAYSESGRDAKPVHSVAPFLVYSSRRLLLIVVTFGLPQIINESLVVAGNLDEIIPLKRKELPSFQKLQVNPLRLVPGATGRTST